MGIDISVKVKEKLTCPKCGEVVGYETFQEFEFSGRELRELITEVGYGSSDYGDYIMLDTKGVKAIQESEPLRAYYSGKELADLAAATLYHGKYVIFFEADW